MYGISGYIGQAQAPPSLPGSLFRPVHGGDRQRGDGHYAGGHIHEFRSPAESVAAERRMDHVYSLSIH